MSQLFRALLARWVVQRDAATWASLLNDSLVRPLAYLHPTAWSPLCGTVRRSLMRPQQASAHAAEHLWADHDARAAGVLAPLPYALKQSALWQLVMCLTRRELLTLAVWCGASVARRRIVGAVDRASARRWRGRLGECLYADVLRRPSDLGTCRPLPPMQELVAGRLLLDLGLSMLAAWTADPHGWARRRIEGAAGPRRRAAEYYLGPEALLPVQVSAAEPALLSFVERQCHEA